jgi:hypothetical protein
MNPQTMISTLNDQSAIKNQLIITDPKNFTKEAPEMLKYIPPDVHLHKEDLCFISMFHLMCSGAVTLNVNEFTQLFLAIRNQLWKNTNFKEGLNHIVNEAKKDSENEKLRKEELKKVQEEIEIEKQMISDDKKAKRKTEDMEDTLKRDKLKSKRIGDPDIYYQDLIFNNLEHEEITKENFDKIGFHNIYRKDSTPIPSTISIPIGVFQSIFEVVHNLLSIVEPQTPDELEFSKKVKKTDQGEIKKTVEELKKILCIKGISFGTKVSFQNSTPRKKGELYDTITKKSIEHVVDEANIRLSLVTEGNLHMDEKDLSEAARRTHKLYTMLSKIHLGEESPLCFKGNYEVEVNNEIQRETCIFITMLPKIFRLHQYEGKDTVELIQEVEELGDLTSVPESELPLIAVALHNKYPIADDTQKEEILILLYKISQKSQLLSVNELFSRIQAAEKNRKSTKAKAPQQVIDATKSVSISILKRAAMPECTIIPLTVKDCIELDNKFLKGRGKGTLNKGILIQDMDTMTRFKNENKPNLNDIKTHTLDTVMEFMYKSPSELITEARNIANAKIGGRMDIRQVDENGSITEKIMSIAEYKLIAVAVALQRVLCEKYVSNQLPEAVTNKHLSQIREILAILKNDGMSAIKHTAENLLWMSEYVPAIIKTNFPPSLGETNSTMIKSALLSKAIGVEYSEGASEEMTEEGKTENMTRRFPKQIIDAVVDAKKKQLKSKNLSDEEKGKQVLGVLQLVRSVDPDNPNPLEWLIGKALMPGDDSEDEDSKKKIITSFTKKAEEKLVTHKPSPKKAEEDDEDDSSSSEDSDEDESPKKKITKSSTKKTEEKRVTHKPSPKKIVKKGQSSPKIESKKVSIFSFSLDDEDSEEVTKEKE